MLVLSRKSNESIHLAGNIKVTVLEVRGKRVRLGIEAPRHIAVVRSEIRDNPPGARTDSGNFCVVPSTSMPDPLQSESHQRSDPA